MEPENQKTIIPESQSGKHRANVSSSADGARRVIRDADRAHRENFRHYVESQSHEQWQPLLPRLYEVWDEMVELSEPPAEMTPPYILFSEPTFNHAYGQYWGTSSFGSSSEIRIRLSLWTRKHPHIARDASLAGVQRFIEDVVRHEFCHQYQREILNDTSTISHSAAFRDVCNKVGKKLGLPDVREGKKRPDAEDKDLPSSAQWPHNVRPSGYYLGAYQPPSMTQAISVRLTQPIAREDARYYREMLESIMAAKLDGKTVEIIYGGNEDS